MASAALLSPMFTAPRSPVGNPLYIALKAKESAAERKYVAQWCDALDLKLCMVWNLCSSLDVLAEKQQLRTNAKNTSKNDSDDDSSDLNNLAFSHRTMTSRGTSHYASLLLSTRSNGSEG